jgi:hypothetical protein
MYTTRRHLLIAVSAIALASPSFATTSLSFEGGDYWIDMEIGYANARRAARAAVASVRFFAPGDKNGQLLSMSRITIETFDTDRKLLLMRYTTTTESKPEPPSFVLSVVGENAVLQLGERRITSRFNWQM